MVCALFATIGGAHGQAITNPSFETDPVPANNGIGPITGWTGGTGTGINDVVGPFADNGVIPAGNKVAFISGSGTLRQTMTGFTPGTRYRLRFFENARACCGGTVSLQVTVGGTTVVAAHSVTAVTGVNPYNMVLSDPFTPSTANLEVVFTSTASGDATLLLDAVSLLPAGLVPTANTFVNAAPLNLARYGHTTTLLRDGRLMVIGGRVPGSNAPTADCQIYDPVINLWTAANPLRVARFNHSATLMPDGKVLVTQGEAPLHEVPGTNHLVNAVLETELYDPVTGRWDAETDNCNVTTYVESCPRIRNRSSATIVPTSLFGYRVLFFGGTVEYDRSGDEAWRGELFSPRTDSRDGSWTMTSGTYVPLGTRGTWKHTATVLLPNVNPNQPSSPPQWVLIAGGARLDGFNNPGPILASTTIYNPAIDIFSNNTPMLTARQNHTAVKLRTGKILVFGGENANGVLSSAELFDPPTNAVYQTPDPGTWTATGSLAARTLHTATLLNDGTVLAAGGLNGTPLSSAQIYNPTTGQWTNTGALLKARYGHTANLMPDGRVFVVGGQDASGNPIGTVEIFNAPNTQITVEQPVDTTITYESRFGRTAPNEPIVLPYFIRNPGTTTLSGISITIDGVDRADFTVTKAPATSVPPLGVTQFNVRFAPTTPGPKLAALHIANNSSASLGTSPYNFNLLGELLSDTADSDGDGLSDAQEWRLRTLGFDYQVKQVAMVRQYFNTANGSGLYNQTQYTANYTSGQNSVINSPNSFNLYTLNQVQLLNVDAPLLTKDVATGKFKLTLGLKKSNNLATTPFADFPMNGAGMTTTVNAQGKLEFVFPATGNAAFFLLQAQ